MNAMYPTAAFAADTPDASDAPDFDISGRALLVAATVRMWNGDKRDRSITREVCDLKGAAADSVRVNKSLLGDAIRPVEAAGRAVRETVAARTLPWMDDGTRVLKGSAYLGFTRAVAGPVAAFEAAVDAFVEGYPAVIEAARRRLGAAFSEADFPPQARLRERFGVKLVYLPVPSGQDFRVALASEEIEAVRRGAEDALREGVRDAVRELLGRMRAPVERMATRLRLYGRDAEGKVEHPFRDSLVDNVREIVGLVPMLDLLDDPEVAAIRAEMERCLTVHDPEALRRSPDLRAKVAGEADEILRRMRGAFG